METSRFLPVRGVCRFGLFEVDLGTGELRKRGVRIALQEQPLRILTALLEARGDIVSRDALCRRVWPEGTFVDFEHSLNAAVRRLRTTLGDTAGVPRFIETVHRRGYRFLALNGVWPADLRRQDADVLRPAPSPSLQGRARLAVMPFAIHGGRAGDAGDGTHAFGEGLTEETITQLARAGPGGVRVIARASVVRLVRSEQSAAEIGRALHADYLVGGSIRGEGTRVRITAQLIESEQETLLWAATYDRTLDDVLTLQVEVADQIARAVVGALSALRPPLSREAAS